MVGVEFEEFSTADTSLRWTAHGSAVGAGTIELLAGHSAVD